MSNKNSTDETVTISGVELAEGSELVLSEDDTQLGEMVVTQNIDPDANEPTKPAPLAAGTTLTVENWVQNPDGINVTFATPFGKVTLNEIGVRGHLQNEQFKPVSRATQNDSEGGGD